MSIKARLEAIEKSLEETYVVRFGNYEPPEVDSSFRCEEAADKRAEELGGMWQVERRKTSGDSLTHRLLRLSIAAIEQRDFLRSEAPGTPSSRR